MKIYLILLCFIFYINKFNNADNKNYCSNFNILNYKFNYSTLLDFNLNINYFNKNLFLQLNFKEKNSYSCYFEANLINQPNKLIQFINFDSFLFDKLNVSYFIIFNSFLNINYKKTIYCNSQLNYSKNIYNDYYNKYYHNKSLNKLFHFEFKNVLIINQTKQDYKDVKTIDFFFGNH